MSVRSSVCHALPSRRAPGWIRILAAHAGLACLLASPAHANADATIPVEELIATALRDNPEIVAALAEREAARERIAPAAALDNPMLEAGVVNAPLPFSLRRDDMTMKMLGLSQKLPFPGKRALRREVAAADASSVGLALEETVDRVARDVRVAYEDLRLAMTSRRLVGETLDAVTQLAALADTRYAVGATTQGEALDAQIQAVKLRQDLLRWRAEEIARQADLKRLLGRAATDSPPVLPTDASLLPLADASPALLQQALLQRPQLQALDALTDRSERELALARREYYPDFEVRVAYGRRERNLDGMPRDDMVTFSVAVDLPIWRRDRLAPRVAEATAMRRQAENLAATQRLDTGSRLAQQLAIEQQQRDGATLFHSTLVPQTVAAFESALAAYRVGRGGLEPLLEARMRVYEAALGEADAIASHNKAVAEIDLLTGRPPQGRTHESRLP